MCLAFDELDRRQQQEIKSLKRKLEFTQERYRKAFDDFVAEYGGAGQEARPLPRELPEAQDPIKPEQPIAQPAPVASAGSTAERDTDTEHVVKGMGRKKGRGKGKAKAWRLRTQLVRLVTIRSQVAAHTA
jgi:hypothetical protein